MSHITKATQTGNRFDFIVCDKGARCVHKSGHNHHRSYRFDLVETQTDSDGRIEYVGSVDDFIREIRNYERALAVKPETVTLSGINESQLEEDIHEEH